MSAAAFHLKHVVVVVVAVVFCVRDASFRCSAVLFFSLPSLRHQRRQAAMLGPEQCGVRRPRAASRCLALRDFHPISGGVEKGGGSILGFGYIATVFSYRAILA